jgi:hypothetical protein
LEDMAEWYGYLRGPQQTKRYRTFVGHEGEAMSTEIGKFVSSAFEELLPGNPLLMLNESDQQFVWAQSYVFLALEGRALKDDPMDALKEAEHIARQAPRWAAELRRVIFGSSVAALLDESVTPFRALPDMLTALSQRLLTGLEPMGKSGHKKSTATNVELVVLSEFLMKKTGSYNDVALAELLQTFPGASPDIDLSAESIGKRRRRLKDEYPVPYEIALSRALKRAA